MTDRYVLPDETSPGAVTLRVASIDGALGFYRDLLGLHVLKRSEQATILGTLSEYGTKHHNLVILREIPDLAPRSRRPTTAGLYHVAFLVDSRYELGRVLVRLNTTGYPLAGTADHAVSESLYLYDPYGNGIEIYADRPRSEWRYENGFVVMTVDPLDTENLLHEISRENLPWKGFNERTRIGHLHFTVSDQREAIRFYHEVLGFDLTLRWPSLTGLSAGGYHHHLNLNTWAGAGAPSDDPSVAGLDSWELILPNETSMEDLGERLKQLHVPVVASGTCLSITDPDGIHIIVRSSGG